MTAPLEIETLPGEFRVALATGLHPARDASDPELAQRLRTVLAEHAVLCIRGCGKLDKPGFRALAEMFGPIRIPEAKTRDGELLRYDEPLQVIDAGFVADAAFRERLGTRSFGGLDEQRPGLFETFHIDDSFVPAPAAATIIHARALPSRGGNTEFLDLRAALRTLAPELGERIRRLRAVHAYNNRGAFASRVPASGPADVLAPVAHPLVRTHPLTGGRALWLDLDRATHVEGLALEEGRALLERLQDHCEARAPRHQHVWQAQDVLIWDNASVQHRARGDFPVGEPRRFWRHMIEGSVPA